MPATAVGRLSEHRADSEHSNRTAVEHRAESVELRAGKNATAIGQSQTVRFRLPHAVLSCAA